MNTICTDLAVDEQPRALLSCARVILTKIIHSSYCSKINEDIA